MDFHCCFAFTEIDDALDKIQQGPSQPARLVIETADTSGVGVSPIKKKVRSNKASRMKKVWAFDETEQLFVTGPTDPVAKPNLSQSRPQFFNSVDVIRRC